MALIQFEGPGPSEVISRYGKCLELIPLDKHFDDISVGLYLKAVSYTHLTLPTKA